MDIWQVVVVMIAFVGIAKWYSWCQVRYWGSSKCKRDWEKDDKQRKNNADRERK